MHWFTNLKNSVNNSTYLRIQWVCIKHIVNVVLLLVVVAVVIIVVVVVVVVDSDSFLLQKGFVLITRLL